MKIKKLVLHLCACAAVGAALAKDVTWTGEDGDAWDAEGSWSATPESGDRALIPANKTVSAVTADMTTFDLFASIDISAGATLFFDKVSKSIAVPFTGKGRFLAIGGSNSFTVDNTAFGGIFAFTNNYCDIAAQNALGSTNAVWLYSSSGSLWKENLFVNRMNGKATICLSNELHLAASSSRCEVMHNQQNPLHIYGPVTFEEGSCQVRTDGYAYFIYFHGGLYGAGSVFGANAQNGVYGIIIDSTIDMTGKLCTFGNGYEIRKPIKNCVFDATRPEYGFKFGAKNVCHDGLTLWFCRDNVYTTGGYYDLNGYDQTCGDICVKPNTTPDFAGCVIKSATPATLTVRGSAGRQYSGKPGTFPGALVGAVSFCYDWDGRTGPKVGSQQNTGGIFTFTGSGHTTTGALTCRAGTLTIDSNATFPNVSGIHAEQTGLFTINSANVGTAGNIDTVTANDSSLLTIAENCTITTRVAQVGGVWLEPGDYVGTTAGKANLAGAGLLHVNAYGGKRGVILFLK